MAKKQKDSKVKKPIRWQSKALQEAFEAVAAAYKKAGITMETFSDMS